MSIEALLVETMTDRDYWKQQYNNLLVENERLEALLNIKPGEDISEVKDGQKTT